MEQSQVRLENISFECPRCEEALIVPVELANQLIDCPICTQTIEVPPSPLCKQLATTMYGRDNRRRQLIIDNIIVAIVPLGIVGFLGLCIWSGDAPVPAPKNKVMEEQIRAGIAEFGYTNLTPKEELEIQSIAKQIGE